MCTVEHWGWPLRIGESPFRVVSICAPVGTHWKRGCGKGSIRCPSHAVVTRAGLGNGAQDFGEMVDEPVAGDHLFAGPQGVAQRLPAGYTITAASDQAAVVGIHR